MTKHFTTTKMQITGFQGGANKAPHSGIVTFDDGKTYEFSLFPDDEDWHFWSYRKRQGVSEQFHFKSDARSTAVQEAINQGRWEDKSVIHVRMD